MGQTSFTVGVLRQAQQLEAELGRVAQTPATAAPRAQVEGDLTVARDAAAGGGGWWSRFMDWATGASVEIAWGALHRAQRALVTVQPAESLRAQVPRLEEIARSTFAPDRAKSEIQTLDSWRDPAVAPDPLVAQRILAAHHAVSDARHQQVRRTRNALYALLGVCAALVVALWVTGVTGGPVVGLGALSGALSVVVLADKQSGGTGVYNLVPAQGLLKLVAGAATAVLAVKVIDGSGGVAVSDSRDALYAVVFGFVQQAFTRLVDQQAQVLSQGPDARNSTDATGAPAAPAPGAAGA
ncbi:hypothetical protein ABIA32_001142 [Streptacidiphilus sp. MAP12-20]|uniref:hypothetical protein n=1 Tax=Streptacidiphilus sp. MAP12-20 TaxID=3156299 RepID=UPI003514B874